VNCKQPGCLHACTEFNSSSLKEFQVFLKPTAAVLLHYIFNCFQLLTSATFLISKGKDHPITCHEGPDGEQRYSSTLSLTSALVGVGG
jgi:hypothetical protein